MERESLRTGAPREYVRDHRFVSCFVRVIGERRSDGRPEIRVSAGATMNPEQTRELIASLTAALETVEGP